MNPRIGQLIRPLLRSYHLLSRPVTLGVRLAAFDAEGRLFLVRHTYLEGWYMPGGGVDTGETAEEAVRREAREEGNLELAEPPVLHGVFFNRRERRDHVLIYRCGHVRQTAPKVPDREIAESGFFALDALPDGLTPATRRRLDELTGQVPLQPDW